MGPNTAKDKIIYLENLRNSLSKWNAKLGDNENEWKGSNGIYMVICQYGHVNYVKGYSIKEGSKCRTCRDTNNGIMMTNMAEIRYKDYLYSIKSIPLWDKWQGMHFQHPIKCVNGHVTYPSPMNVMTKIRKRYGCSACSGRNTYYTELRFIEVLKYYNCIPMWNIWRGCKKKHSIKCINDHINDVIPDHILTGNSKPCVCYSYDWDIFYVIINDLNNTFKFGITSHSEKIRVDKHRRDGYTRIVVMAKNVDARSIENNIKSLLKNNGFKPIFGYEYFDILALNIVINELDNENLNRIDN